MSELEEPGDFRWSSWHFTAVLPLRTRTSMTAPAAVCACYAACGKAWTVCYAAAGLVAGTVVAGPLAPAAALTCNVAESACMGACTSAAASQAIAESMLNPTALPMLAAVAAVAMKAMKRRHSGDEDGKSPPSRL